MRIILLFLMLYSTCEGSEESKEAVTQNNGYAFYYPLSMIANQPTKVCLAIDKNLLPAVVKISFGNRTCNDCTPEPYKATSEFSCWQIVAPASGDRYNYEPSNISVEIDTKDPNVKFEQHEQVQIHDSMKKIIAETDRRVYKMGDTVKMRFLAFDFDMKPIKDYQISNLQVRSPYPSSAIVKQWENVTTDLGLAHLEFPLAPDAPEGYWSISGDGVYTSFEVKKYVLPRFEVVLTGPDSIHNDSTSVVYKVCGKYSYGRNIKGVALFAVKVNRINQDTTSINKVKDLKDGCAEFELFTEDLEQYKGFVWLVELTASVTEEGTEQVQSTSQNTYINAVPYNLNWDYKRRHIKSKLPYEGKLGLTDVHIPLVNGNNPIVQLCYSLYSTTEETCSNFTLDSDNKLTFTIPPLMNLSESDMVQVQATVPSAPLSYPPSYILNVWHSNNSDGIMIIDNQKTSVDCRSNLIYTVLYNSARFKDGEEIEFKYMVTSRGEIISTGSVLDTPKKGTINLDKYPNVIGKEDYENVDNPLDHFELNINLDKNIYTTAKLLIYYEYDGEVIADDIEVDVSKCGPNQVTAKWNEETFYPGETGKLHIETDQDSLCSVSSVDKASTFLGDTFNKISIDSLLNTLYRYAYIYKQNCIKPADSNTTNDRIYEHYISPSSYDASDAFKNSDVGVISNLQFIAKKCEKSVVYDTQPHYADYDFDSNVFAIPENAASLTFDSEGVNAAPTPVGGSGGAAGPGVDKRGSAVRLFFPETWLWDLVPVKQGEITLERKLPDSITDWEGNVLCMSSNSGFGISNGIKMRGFKPFFVDIVLPYSIKRNKEILHLPIPVFNYLNHSLPIRVTLEPSDDIVLMDGEDKNSFTMCLEAGDSYTHHYRVKATKTGYVPITVAAKVDPAYAKDCAPDSVIRRRDVVQKSLLVEPEGYPSSLIKSALLCANDSLGVDNIEWSINLPEHVVEDTVDGQVTVNSDILGPMFQNLESILVMPTGCGEQTMATLTPNLYVLKYLEANKALTDEVKKKIFKNLEIGYQRMLNYVHSDGSFSAFGSSDKDGSMFLTSFVIRTFRQMKKYIFIDDDVINKAIGWVIKHQLENGCFDPVHHVLHDMGLASSENQTTALTSYILISFLETNTKIDEKILSKAKECILADETADKYTLAISSYALGLLNLTEEAKERLDKLNEVADSKEGMTWWTQSDKSQSANVEVSSYVLMSLLTQDPISNLGSVSSIVRWLQSKMNPRGGFFSTVDTVVGLDAISRYALLVNDNEPNVEVSLQTKTDKKDLEISKRDRTRTDIVPLTEYPNEVRAQIEGDGCVSVQASVNYYLDKPLGMDDLQLDIQLKPVNQRLKCSMIEIKPCVAYTAPGKINMAIVEVNMLSGYAPDQASLYELTADRNSAVKKFEQIKNQVVFYLTQLGAEKVCLPFKVEENLIVENIANATVKLYDYYKPEVSISKSFTVGDCEANINVPA